MASCIGSSSVPKLALTFQLQPSSAQIQVARRFSLLRVRKVNLSLTAQLSRARTRASISRNSAPSIGQTSSPREDILRNFSSTSPLKENTKNFHPQKPVYALQASKKGNSDDDGGSDNEPRWYC